MVLVLVVGLNVGPMKNVSLGFCADIAECPNGKNEGALLSRLKGRLMPALPDVLPDKTRMNTSILA